MYYVCIEEGQVISVLNYEPTVPDSISVATITDDEYQQINDETHCFNPQTLRVEPTSNEVLENKVILEENAQHRDFLESTDWKILRHIRQQALGLETSLSEDEYLDLEQRRQAAAERIKNV